MAAVHCAEFSKFVIFDKRLLVLSVIAFLNKIARKRTIRRGVSAKFSSFKILYFGQIVYL